MPFDVRGRENTVRIRDADYELIRARKDGNCLFHAAGHGLVTAGRHGAEFADHMRFRAHVVQYVADHAKETNALGFKLRDGMGITGNQQDAVSDAQRAAIDRRVEYLRGARSWGDEACITAIERLYDVEVLVFDDQGGDQALGVPYYTASHAKDAKLRLCIRLVGHIPVHYDVFLTDYDAERDGGNAVVEVVKKGDEVSQSAKEPWAYHMNPDGLKLFCPAIGPRQMTYSRAVLDALGKSRLVVKPVAVALGRELNVVERPAPVVAVSFRNRKDKAQLASQSFSAATDPGELVKAVQEPLVLPLVRVEKACVNLLDLSSTDLLIDVERGKAAAPAVVYLRLCRRAFGRLGRGVPNGGLLDEIELNLAKLKAKSEDLDKPDRTRFTLDASALSDHLVRMMEWQASPFQVVASSDRGFDPAASAWTHAHVPSEIDILHAEYLARVLVLMLDDSPAALGALGVDASMNDLANPAIEGEQPKGRETFAMPLDKQQALEQLAGVAGLGRLDANAHNYLVEVAEGEWYASTSWASMASLQLNEKEGRYYLHALYWSGDARAAYQASAADLAARDQRAQGVEVVAVERVLGLVSAARSALSAAASVTAGLEASRMFPTLRARSFYTAIWVFNGQERAEFALLSTFRDRHAVALQRVGALKADVEARQILLKLGHDTADLALPAFDDAVQPIVQMLDVQACVRQCDAMYAAIFRRKADLLQKGLVLDFEEVEGIKDFELEGGKRLAKGADWKRHVFDPPLKLTCAVTAGISSCAGGVTVSSEKGAPAHVFMWHLDASLSIPLLAEMERLWPKGDKAPAMRTLALVTPSLWELNKYRPDNLYPAKVVGDSGTVFLGRGPHWYGKQPVVAGCDLFGLDLRTKGQLDLVFTYDIDKRTEALGMWRHVVEASEDAPVVLTYFRDNLLGTYRYEDADPKTPAEMAQYIGRVSTEVVLDQAAIKRHKRVNSNKSCRVPQVSAGVIDAVAKHALPLLELRRQLAAEKGDQELALDQVEEILKSRWAPGSR
ncbi:OTU domain-containing protein [Sorangium sp. So ce362]|uniref:OTU domain-containing protein n=1 Tax=Sorangium sp. So ce362 TaxID=3133303 RepID=UPI003F632C18